MSFSLSALQAEFEQLVAQDPLGPAKPLGEAGLPPPPAPAKLPCEAGILIPPPPPAPAAAAGAPPPLAPAKPQGEAGPQVQLVDFAARGFHFDARVQPTQVVAAAEIMDRHGFALDAVSGVDWLTEQQMEVVYDFFHPTASCRAVVRARVPRAEPALSTISGVFAGANWHERETAEFFGIKFLGHPNLIPLLLPEDATFHPLRKDFAGA